MNTLVENIFNNNDNEEVSMIVSNASKIFTKLKNDAIKEGLEEGIKEGEVKGKSNLLVTQLIKRFPGLSDYYIKKIKSFPEETIELIATDIFDLKKVEDIDKYL